jgi:DNA-binding PadR family transcriptional regulator
VLFKHGVLALLDGQARHGYEIKTTLETQTGGLWAVNVGQVYATVQRLVRDGLVEELEDVDSEGRTIYRITDGGKAQLERWYATPIGATGPARDELALKVMVAVASETVDVTAILQAQRRATLEQMQGFTRQKSHSNPDTELPWILMIDALILKAEAEIRWLDLCEERLRHRAVRRESASAPTGVETKRKRKNS